MPTNYSDPGGDQYGAISPYRPERQPYSVRRTFQPGAYNRSQTQATEISGLRAMATQSSGGLRGRFRGAAGGGGFKEPNLGSGSESAIMEKMRQRAMMDYPAMVRQYTLASDLESGGDPYLKAYGALQGRFKAGESLARGLSEADLELLLSSLGYDRQLQMQRLGQGHELNMANRYAKANKRGVGSYIGQVVGMGAGAFAGGVGGGVAKRFFP